jgi:hypothetical protein
MNSLTNTMKIIIMENTDYDKGVYPEVTEIRFIRDVTGDF